MDVPISPSKGLPPSSLDSKQPTVLQNERLPPKYTQCDWRKIPHESTTPRGPWHAWK